MVLPIEVPAEDLPVQAAAPPTAPAAPPIASGAEVPESDIPVDYSSGLEMAKTAAEQLASGITLGGSKVLETQLLGVKPEAIAAREAEHPITSFASNVLGTGALIAGTGGLGGLAEGAGALGKVTVGSLEGSGIGVANQIADDWSQNKALDAQKIAASAGIGALIGGLGAGLVEGVKGRFSSRLPKSSEVPTGARPLVETTPVDAPVLKTGVQPTSLDEMAARVKASQADGTAVELPAKAELSDAISRVGMENPVSPAQAESLGSQQSRDTYQSAKEMPGKVGHTLTSYEGAQKNELIQKTTQAIQDLSPGVDPIADAVKGGKAAIDAFTKQYQAEKQALKPIFDELKTLPINGDILPDSISAMSDAVPNIANMFDTSGSEIAIKPYKTLMGIDKATYMAVKDAVESLKEAPNTMDALWKIRSGLDQNIDALAQGKGPAEIRSLKASLMQYMQDSSPSQDVREAFKRYAINEQERQVIEKTFGASVGTPEFGSLSKVKPEVIGDRIFGNTANVAAAKKILPPEQFNHILSNWLAEAKAAATDKGAFSSNKFGSFLRRNQDALNVAFSDNPAQLQRLRDLTTIMRILPDSASINPSGTAKTLIRMMGEMPLHNLTWEGLLASIPQKIAAGIGERVKIGQVNASLAGKATESAATTMLKRHASKINTAVESGVKSLFYNIGAQTRKIQR